ncbi:MAG: ProQ/FinO family protein [Pseudomonadota bacterium]
MSSPEPRSGRRNALLDQFIALYPVFRDAKPLAIGIHKAMLEQQPDLDKAALRTAMKMHTHSTRYLKGIVEGAPRYDLAGNPEGSVTAEQQEQAVAILKERAKKAKERRKAEETARKAEEEAAKRQAQLSKLVEKFNTR